MKTYALSLLILCFSVIGCQKDIGNEAKPKNKKAKKYLPTEIRTISSEVIDDNSPKATESWVFPYLLRSTVKLTYKDDEGNLLKFARWDTVGSEKYYYFAKDVKNKEIIYLVLPGLFYPTCKDLASITDLSPEAGNFYCKFDNEYNEDDYPIVVETDLKIYNGAFYHTQNQVKINYKVIE